MKQTVNMAVSNDKCTGCGACMNVCPADAISMGHDREGFLYPDVTDELCVECGKCTQCCPVIHDENNNTKTPRVFAVRADDVVRSVSSSGGIFSVLANAVLNKGGIVCGAAFDQDMQLRHILVERKEDMGKLRGSKYLQSNVGTVYREIRLILNEGRDVLFTGTPCQNAALKRVLGKEYENLLTVDVLCHGVPSQKIFSQYLNEISNEKNVEFVDFRNKRFGWQAEKFLFKYSDGSEYTSNIKKDPFVIGFHRNLFLQAACSDCVFSEYPREGDLSMGDFWGIGSIDKTQDDAKGTSLLFINNKKGENAFEQVKEEFYKIKEYPFMDVYEQIDRKNRTHAHYPANKNRNQFFRIFDQMGNVTRSVKLALPGSIKEYPGNTIQKKYDIGLVSNYLAVNFGGSLTQYALYNVLKEMGFSVGMIERPRNAPVKVDFNNFERMYLECPYDIGDLLPRYNNLLEMEQLNQACDKFVVGSDQLFQYALYREIGKLVSLSWVKDTKNKVAYAGSFGHGEIWGNKDELAELGYFLKKYDAFSVREKDAVQICKNHFDVDAEWVLDPVFLCDKKVYEDLAKKSGRKLMPHYIASYILDPSRDKQKILRTVMNETGLPVEIYSEMFRHEDYIKYVKPLGDLNVIELKVEERLNSILHCDFFVTDSFHGTCLAIIMGKPFISILNMKRGGSRFYSLLEIFGLQHRLIKDSNALNENKRLIHTAISYDQVESILKKEKNRCLTWLKSSLGSSKRNLYSEYDMMKKLIADQQHTIQLLQKEIRYLAKITGKESCYITNFREYLDYLYLVKNEYLILIAVKDTPGLALDQETAEKMKMLGLKTYLFGRHGRSYAAILDGGENIYEELGEDEEPIDVKVQINGIPESEKKVRLVSRVYKNGNEARIEYCGKDYAVNKRGINIVLVCRKNGVVEDTVCFDTHVREYLCSRTGTF